MFQAYIPSPSLQWKGTYFYYPIESLSLSIISPSKGPDMPTDPDGPLATVTPAVDNELW